MEEGRLVSVALQRSNNLSRSTRVICEGALDTASLLALFFALRRSDVFENWLGLTKM